MLRVLWVERFASIPGCNYAMLVPNLARFAVTNQLNCALNWKASVRRGVHMNHREAGVLPGRFREIVAYIAELD